MERVEKNNIESVKKPNWKKVGGGSLRIGKQIIKPNQIFAAYPEEISPAFRNMVIPVSADAVFKTPSATSKEDVAPVIEGVKPTYTMQLHGKSLFLYDVLDAQGKIINEKSMKKEVAEKLIEDLQK